MGLDTRDCMIKLLADSYFGFVLLAALMHLTQGILIIVNFQARTVRLSDARNPNQQSSAATAKPLPITCSFESFPTR